MVDIFNPTSICHRMTNYPIRWACSGSRDLNLKFGTLHNCWTDAKFCVLNANTVHAWSTLSAYENLTPKGVCLIRSLKLALSGHMIWFYNITWELVIKQQLSMKKTWQFKIWCNGDKSNIENSTDHFCEVTRQNALAAVTNLGHLTPFLLLGPPHHLTIQWVREITSLDSELPD